MLVLFSSLTSSLGKYRIPQEGWGKMHSDLKSRRDNNQQINLHFHAQTSFLSVGNLIGIFCFVAFYHLFNQLVFPN